MRSHVRVSLLALVAGALVAAVGSRRRPGRIRRGKLLRLKLHTVNTCKRMLGESPRKKRRTLKRKPSPRRADIPTSGSRTSRSTRRAPSPTRCPKASGGIVTHVRTDVAPGVSTNPEAVPEVLVCRIRHRSPTGSGLFLAPTCKAESQLGVNEVVVWLGRHRRQEVQTCRWQRKRSTTSYSRKASPRTSGSRSNFRNRSPKPLKLANAHLPWNPAERSEKEAVLRAYPDRRQRRMGRASEGNRQGRLSRLLRNQRLAGTAADQLAADLQRQHRHDGGFLDGFLTSQQLRGDRPQTTTT